MTDLIIDFHTTYTVQSSFILLIKRYFNIVLIILYLLLIIVLHIIFIKNYCIYKYI